MTNEETTMTNEELAKRAIACKHWRWVPGMGLIDHDAVEVFGLDFARERVIGMERDDDDELWLITAWDDEVDRTLWSASRGTCLASAAVPDLDDPATLGCLLTLVREAWGSKWCSVLVSNISAEVRVGRNVLSCVTFQSMAATLSEAFVVALEAAP